VGGKRLKFATTTSTKNMESLLFSLLNSVDDNKNKEEVELDPQWRGSEHEDAIE
jgi:hypothetical protein